MRPFSARMIIYPKDIEIITGRRSRTAQNILLQIKKHYNIKKRDFITIYEFCEFMQMKEEFVREILTDV